MKIFQSLSPNTSNCFFPDHTIATLATLYLTFIKPSPVHSHNPPAAALPSMHIYATLPLFHLPRLTRQTYISLTSHLHHTNPLHRQPQRKRVYFNYSFSQLFIRTFPLHSTLSHLPREHHFVCQVLHAVFLSVIHAAIRSDHLVTLSLITQ